MFNQRQNRSMRPRLSWRQVSFADSSWTEFLKDAVREACGTLGVDFGAVAPRAEPEKFVMLGKDAR